MKDVKTKREKLREEQILCQQYLAALVCNRVKYYN